MDTSEFKEFIIIAFTSAASVAAVLKIIIDAKEANSARERLLEAEKDAFRGLTVAPEQTNNTDSNFFGKSALPLEVQDQVQVGKLFDLYSKQIEKYQTETQARAGWSFVFAIFSMVSGLSFVVWGGFHVLTNPGWEHVAAATGISGIGGAVGAFITKTFLDVHRLSLSQLNHYFRQPVVNAHVLTGQRLADQISDPALRQQAYQQLLSQVCSLIREDTYPGSVWVANATSNSQSNGTPSNQTSGTGSSSGGA